MSEFNQIVQGADELDAMLRQLAPKVQKKYLRVALRAGAKVFKREVQVSTPVRSGQMLHNLKVRAGKRNRQGGKVSMLVSFGKRWFAGKTFYAGFVVFGHRVGKRPSGGRPGKVVAQGARARTSELTRRAARALARSTDTRPIVPGNDFMQRAFDASRAGALAAFTDSMKKQLNAAPKDLLQS